MVSMANLGKVLRYFYGLDIENYNFIFEIKILLGLESTKGSSMVIPIKPSPSESIFW